MEFELLIKKMIKILNKEIKNDTASPENTELLKKYNSFLKLYIKKNNILKKIGENYLSLTDEQKIKYMGDFISLQKEKLQIILTFIELSENIDEIKESFKLYATISDLIIDKLMDFSISFANMG